MGQTTYRIAPTKGIRGLPFDMSFSVKRSVRLNAGAAEPFGIFVKEGGVNSGLDGDVQPLAANTDKVAGVLMHTHDIRQDPSTTALVAGVDVPDLSIVPLMEKGKIYVLKETGVTITAGDPVYVRVATNGAGKTQLGACTNAQDDAAKAMLVKGAKWIVAAASTDLFGAIEFDVNAALT